MDGGEVVGPQFFLNSVQVDGFGFGEIDTALDSRVKKYAVEGRVRLYDSDGIVSD